LSLAITIKKEGMVDVPTIPSFFSLL